MSIFIFSSVKLKTYIKFVFSFALSLFLFASTFALDSWDNDYFVNDSFWRQNPTDQEIKEAFFGTISDNKTAYTQERTNNSCNNESISVVNISNYSNGGIDTIPHNLTDNKIYLLESGTYITSAQIDSIGDCVALIGKGDVTIYSSTGIDNGTIKVSVQNNNIISNIRLDGLYNGTSGNHPVGNNYAIYFYNAYNSSVDNVVSYNNKHGLYFSTLDNCTLTNSIFFNNSTYGIYFYAVNAANYVSNVQVFNNSNIGFYVRNSDGVIIENSQFYNNDYKGIYFNNVSDSLISNCMSYNNMRYGIHLYGGSSNNIINNSLIFNNNNEGIYGIDGTNNKYYGSIKIFNNDDNANANLMPGIVTAGNSGDSKVNELSFDNGTIDNTPIINYDYITNPRDTNGNYLINGTSWSSTNRGFKDVGGLVFDFFDYGSNVIKQNQNIKYDSTTLGLSDLYYHDMKYIGQFEFENKNPDNFTFNETTGASLDTEYTSNTVTLAGMDSGAREYVYIDRWGTLYKNGVAVGKSTTGSNGDQFYIKITSSNSYNTYRETTMFVGTTHSDFRVTTFQAAFDDIPDAFTLNDVNGADLNTEYLSNTITLTGMDNGVSTDISVSGAGTIFKNGQNMGASTTGENGDQFYIRLTSSSNYNQTVSSTLTANTVSSTFNITTLQDLVFPTFNGVTSGTTYSEPVTITYSDSNLSGATLNGNNYINGTEISDEGEYVFIVSDTAGNSTGATFRMSCCRDNFTHLL